MKIIEQTIRNSSEFDPFQVYNRFYVSNRQTKPPILKAEQYMIVSRHLVHMHDFDLKIIYMPINIYNTKMQFWVAEEVLQIAYSHLNNNCQTRLFTEDIYQLYI